MYSYQAYNHAVLQNILSIIFFILLKRDRYYNTNSVAYYMSLYKLYQAKKDVETFP